DAASTFFGHSAIIDPWGNAVVEAGETEILLTATIDTDMVATVRQKIPVFKDRRPDLYRLDG
ncbi:MAG: carbon-nitrogen family hydrolase, partial [Anaerolineae bacterium]|nr:carbon-nitrogen family hydrolase [Anaerolineae bacterium]